MTDRLPILLMTRPRPASEMFAGSLRAAGARFETVISPLIDIVFADVLPDLDGVRGLVFTSANGVAAWQALGGTTDLPAWAVGRATADAARAAGLDAQSADGDADSLVADLASRGPQAPLLHIRGRHARGDVAARLTASGIETREAVLYDQPERPLTHQALLALSGNLPIVAPVFSPRTAALLGLAPIRAPFLVAAMSETVAKALGPLHIREMKVARRPDAESMLACTVGLLAQARMLVTPRGAV